MAPIKYFNNLALLTPRICKVRLDTFLQNRTNSFFGRNSLACDGLKGRIRLENLPGFELLELD